VGLPLVVGYEPPASGFEWRRRRDFILLTLLSGEQRSESAKVLFWAPADLKAYNSRPVLQVESDPVDLGILQHIVVCDDVSRLLHI
jgi:hypothetical protein